MNKNVLDLIRNNKLSREKGEKAAILHLVNVRVKELPIELFDLIWLEELVITDDDAPSPRPPKIDENVDSNASSITEPENNIQNSIFDISNEIFALSNLEKLIITGHPNFNRKLKDISSLSSLKKLKYLDLSRNEISDISPLFDLLELEYLSISGNKIFDLSPISRLDNLVELHFSGNPVKSIEALSTLFHLKILKFLSTDVEDLTPLVNLTRLEKLLFAGNKVYNLSPLAGLSQLIDLDFSYNLVKDISPLLSSLRKELVIQGKGNPLTTPPVEIFEKGRLAILFYFSEIEKDRGNKLYEAKCLFIGEGGSGKTTLAHKLIDEKSNPPQEQDTTKGIEVIAYDFQIPDGNEFRLHLWDFGGQEIYHATHQLFLTKRSIYVLLDDTRKDDRTIHDPSFNYWFQVAELFGHDSPLIIVQNEKGGRSKQIDENAIKGRFGFFQGACQTDLLSGKGLNEVRRKIEKLAWQLPHVGLELPKRWVDVRRTLKYLSRNDDHISIEKYYEICTDHGLSDRKSADFLGEFLHDLGVFLHFRDNPLLRNTIIINNQWATDAIYKVIDSEKVKKQFGRFGREDLSVIWDSPKYRNQHDELVALMEKFELCYKLPDVSEETWLIPQLLQISQPIGGNIEWPSETISIRYKYDFMPRGLLSRFVVRVNRYVKDLSLAWKSGVVLHRGNSIAIVTESWGDREIKIKAAGNSAKELITIITEDFDRMHDLFGRLSVQKLIPCICSICYNSDNPYYFQYDSLVRRKEHNRFEVECDFSYEMMMVSELIDGTFSSINTGQIAKEIIHLIEIGNTQEGLSRLSNSFDFKETSLWQAKYALYHSNYFNGTIPFEQYISAVQKINLGIIKLLSGLL